MKKSVSKMIVGLVLAVSAQASFADCRAQVRDSVTALVYTSRSSNPNLGRNPWKFYGARTQEIVGNKVLVTGYSWIWNGVMMKGTNERPYEVTVEGNAEFCDIISVRALGPFVTIR